ncbi:MAG: hypothetical protein RLO52_38115 [Sandaracinaceae bacterium]|nr:MAG: hypothetical protein EVA89_15985 [Sandaracinaceae bacterium]
MSDTSDAVEDLALGAFRLVKEKLGFELDFTAETLPVLDQYLIDLRDEDGGTPDEKVVALVAPCCGAYFGEVLRRTLPDLRWHTPKDDYQRWRLEGERVFISLNPIGAVLEALYGKALADWAAHLALLPGDRDAVTRSLEATGPVREEDFHRLAIRHEVTEQALDVLAGLRAGSEGPLDLSPEVYASLLDDKRPSVDA